MAKSLTSRDIEDLAADIGKDVYIDVAKWHLYLNDAHLHTELAEQFAPLIESGSISEQSLKDVLRGISIKIGGGTRELPLIDFLPVQCQVSLMDILEEYA